MLPNRLDRSASGSIVNELVEVLGKARTVKVLDVDDARFRFLTTGRGCLTNLQLERITSRTGIAWQKWGIEAVARRTVTPEDKQLLAATRKMWARIESAGKRPTTSRSDQNPRRVKMPALRHAI
jgi:hypothetical protein